MFASTRNPIPTMPATAGGRCRMPHNNRMHTGGSLKTHAIWQKAIGYDPYANPEEEQQDAQEAAAAQERSKGLLELAKLKAVGASSYLIL